MKDPLADVVDHLARIEAALHALALEKSIKDRYSTAEVAALVGKAEYTVREWCRQGRIRASKKSYSRGAHAEWLISRDELARFRSEGLLALRSNGQ